MQREVEEVLTPSKNLFHSIPFPITSMNLLEFPHTWEKVDDGDHTLSVQRGCLPLFSSSKLEVVTESYNL
jgi:hypothetical protein